MEVGNVAQFVGNVERKLELNIISKNIMQCHKKLGVSRVTLWLNAQKRKTLYGMNYEFASTYTTQSMKISEYFSKSIFSSSVKHLSLLRNIAPPTVVASASGNPFA